MSKARPLPRQLLNSTTITSTGVSNTFFSFCLVGRPNLPGRPYAYSDTGYQAVFRKKTVSLNIYLMPDCKYQQFPIVE